MARDILDAVREDLGLFEQVLLVYAGKLAISPELGPRELMSGPWRFKSVSLSRLEPRHSRALLSNHGLCKSARVPHMPGPKNPVSVLMIRSMRTGVGFG